MSDAPVLCMYEQEQKWRSDIFSHVGTLAKSKAYPAVRSLHFITPSRTTGRYNLDNGRNGINVESANFSSSRAT